MNREIATTEQQIVESLARVCRLANLVRDPAARKAAHASLVDLSALVVALRRRVEYLESRPAIKFRGIWSSAVSYPAGSVVVSRGSSWLATAETVGVQPAEDNALWQCLARKGRDARHPPRNEST